MRHRSRTRFREASCDRYDRFPTNGEGPRLIGRFRAVCLKTEDNPMYADATHLWTEKQLRVGCFPSYRVKSVRVFREQNLKLSIGSLGGHF